MNDTVAILLPVYNHLEYTQKTLDEIAELTKTAGQDKFCTIVVDDGSTDGTSAWIEKHHPEVILLKGDGNLWWSGGMNIGARYAIEKLGVGFVLLYNNDIQIAKNYFTCLRRIIREIDEDTIVGSKVYVKENPEIVWSMGGFFNRKNGKYGMYGYYEKDSDEFKKIIEADWLAGMGTLIPTRVIRKIGYWDDVNFPQYHGDSDFTFRAKVNGFKIIVSPDLVIYNSVKNSGIDRKESIREIIDLMTDVRSKSNLKKNLLFYKKHSVSLSGYIPLFWIYFKLFGGFFKWKLLNIIGIQKKHDAEKTT